MKNFFKFRSFENIVAILFFLNIALLIFTSFVTGTETKKDKQITQSVTPRLEMPDSHRPQAANRRFDGGIRRTERAGS